MKLYHEDKEINMPGLLSLKLAAYKKVNAFLLEITKIDGIKDQSKKAVKALEAQTLLVEAAEALCEHYPQYADFASDFSALQHLNIMKALGQGTNKHDVEQELAADFLSPAQSS